MLGMPLDAPLYARRLSGDVVGRLRSALERLGVPGGLVRVEELVMIVSRVPCLAKGVEEPAERALRSLRAWYGARWLEESGGRLLMPGEQEVLMEGVTGVEVKGRVSGEVAAYVVTEWRARFTVNGRPGRYRLKEWSSVEELHVTPVDKAYAVELVRREARRARRELLPDADRGGGGGVRRLVDDLIEEMIEDFREEEEGELEVVEEEHAWRVRGGDGQVVFEGLVNKYTGLLESLEVRLTEEGARRLVRERLGDESAKVYVWEADEGYLVHAVSRSQVVVATLDPGSGELKIVKSLPGLEWASRSLVGLVYERYGVTMPVGEASWRAEGAYRLVGEVVWEGVVVRGVYDLSEGEVRLVEVKASPEGVKRLVEEALRVRAVDVVERGDYTYVMATDGVKSILVRVGPGLELHVVYVSIPRGTALRLLEERLERAGITGFKPVSLESDGRGGWVIRGRAGLWVIEGHVTSEGEALVTRLHLDEEGLKRLLRDSLGDVIVLRAKPLETRSGIVKVLALTDQGLTPVLVDPSRREVRALADTHA